MLRRLYTSTVLILMPSVETILVAIRTLVQRLDRLTDAIERDLEEQVVALANNARRRREALEAANARFDAKDATRMAVLQARQQKLDKAAAARDNVAAFLDGLN